MIKYETSKLDDIAYELYIDSDFSKKHQLLPKDTFKYIYYNKVLSYGPDYNYIEIYYQKSKNLLRKLKLIEIENDLS